MALPLLLIIVGIENSTITIRIPFVKCCYREGAVTGFKLSRKLIIVGIENSTITTRIPFVKCCYHEGAVTGFKLSRFNHF